MEVDSLTGRAEQCKRKSSLPQCPPPLKFILHHSTIYNTLGMLKKIPETEIQPLCKKAKCLLMQGLNVNANLILLGSTSQHIPVGLHDLTRLLLAILMVVVNYWIWYHQLEASSGRNTSLFHGDMYIMHVILSLRAAQPRLLKEWIFILLDYF